MRAPRRLLTRDQLTRALVDADRPDLADGFYARRLDYCDGGGIALAFDFDAPGDLGLFLVTVAALLDQPPAMPGDGADFAAALRLGLPAHPGQDSVLGMSGAYWPGWELCEPTGDQWDDSIGECIVCRALDDGRCTPHATAPWDARPALVP